MDSGFSFRFLLNLGFLEASVDAKKLKTILKYLMHEYRIFAQGPAKDMLDAMQVLLTGSGTFDEDFYAEYVSCLDQFDPRLMSAVDAQWQGMLDYASAGGNPEGGDPWEPCTKVSCKQVTSMSRFIFE
jgi:hypothetical protein